MRCVCGAATYTHHSVQSRKRTRSTHTVIAEKRIRASVSEGSGGAELLREQVTCSTCHVGLWNLYLAPKDTANEKRCYCFECCDDKKTELCVHFLWAHPRKLRQQFDEHCKELCGK